MTLPLDELLFLTREVLWSGLVVFLRIGAMMALLPAFGEQSVPMRVRLALALAFTLLVMPAVAPLLVPPPESALRLTGQLGGEVLIGLFLGLLTRLFVLTLSVAGSIAAQSTSLAQIFGNAGVEPQPAIGHLMVIAGLALATLLGLHVRLAAMMIVSYELLPFGVLPGGGAVAELGLARVARLFAFAFSLAAPFVIAAALYNLTLGVINRAMPQLMVSFVGAPMMTFGGLLILTLALPTGLALWADALLSFLAAPLAVPR